MSSLSSSSSSESLSWPIWRMKSAMPRRTREARCRPFQPRNTRWTVMTHAYTRARKARYSSTFRENFSPALRPMCPRTTRCSAAVPRASALASSTAPRNLRRLEASSFSSCSCRRRAPVSSFALVASLIGAISARLFFCPVHLKPGLVRISEQMDGTEIHSSNTVQTKFQMNMNLFQCNVVLVAWFHNLLSSWMPHGVWMIWRQNLRLKID
mmetsp:Transcript_23739/g.40905  ORF Transcript_23739/g.40905 Transcript_23739/m.40905 type:complete len:211 (+) Transcript_23739:220-852(+)